MDEGKQVLSEAEQQQLNAEAEVQQAEAQTGTTAIPRTAATQDPVQLDPRFDRDDLRQGKPPPALKQRNLRRKVKVRRPRAKKGQPFKMSGEQGAEGATTDGEAEEAELTDDEVEVEEVHEGEGEAEAEENKKKGIIGKMLGKNSTM